MKHRFPKSCRLLHKKDFQIVFKKNDRKAGKFLIVEIALKENSLGARLGIIVTKKFGKAHERNRFKRLVRESFRKLRGTLKGRVDCVIRPKHQFPVSVTSQQSISQDLELILREYIQP